MNRPRLASNLQLVDARAGSLIRAQRIDALSVDRSRFIGCPMLRWSVEAEAHEPQWEQLRAETTLAERIAAWRKLAQLPGVSK